MKKNNWKLKKIFLISIFIFLSLISIRAIDVFLRYDVDIRTYYEMREKLTLNERELLSQKPLLVGVYEDHPLTFLNVYNNRNTGVLIDYIYQLEIELGQDIYLKSISKENLQKNLDEGNIDVAIIEKTADIEKKYAISQNLCNVKGKIILKNKYRANDLKDIRGKTLVSLRDDTVLERIDKSVFIQNDIKILEVDNIYQCFALIRNKKTIGFIGDNMESEHFLNVTNASQQFYVMDTVFYERSMVFASTKHNANLVNILNKGLFGLKNKNLIRQTQYKWLGNFDDVGRDINQIELIYKIVGVVASIIAFLSIWNYGITKEVNRKTKELLENKQELRTIMDSIPEVIAVIEKTGEIVECNDSLIKLTNLTRDKIIGTHYNEIETLKDIIAADKNKVFRYGSSYYYVTSQEYVSNRTLVTIEDYTEKYLQERMARQESKMIAVGQLSAGLAHEIRNPLGLIKSYTYVIKKEFMDNSDDEVFQSAIDVISESVRRISALIDNLLRFSRLSNDYKKLVDLRQLVEMITKLEEKNVKNNNIDIKINITGNAIRPILINEDVLKMILVNLIHNSIESFKDVKRDNKFIKVEIKLNYKTINISVSDNGCGMSLHEIENVFNPFYSTKETGTGLGLYLINTEVSNLNGKLSVDSQEGSGSKFNVLLPIEE